MKTLAAIVIISLTGCATFRVPIYSSPKFGTLAADITVTYDPPLNTAYNPDLAPYPNNQTLKGYKK